MKKTFSLLLCILMALTMSTVAFAGTTYSGRVNGDVTIASGDTIAADAEFYGKVTIKAGVTVATGVFHNDVTLEGYGTLLDVGFGIRGGVFNGTVTNNGYINDGNGTSPVFNGKVINNKTIYNGTFKGTVENSGTIGSGIFNGKVVNNGTINGGVYNNSVENKSKLAGGSYRCYIFNNGGTLSNISAIVYTETDGKKTWTVKNAPYITSSVTAGSGSTFNCPAGTSVHVTGNGELCLNGSTIVNGNIYAEDGGKIKSDTGSLDSSSQGTIWIKAGSSFNGLKKNDFAKITKTQYSITCPQNTDDMTMLVVQSAAYSGDKVGFNINLNAQIFKSCYTVTGIEVKDAKGNLITKTTDNNSSFIMPDSNVKITVTYTESHTRATKAPTCTEDGYDYCTKCPKIFEDTIVPKLGHQGTWNVSTRPTETTPGYKTMHCSRCNHDVREVIPAAYGVSIKGSNKTVGFRTNLVFYADWSECPGAKLVWVVNGEEHDDSGSKTYKVDQARGDQTVSVKVVDSTNGKVYKTREIKISVEASLWNKIVAFFKYLFKEPPTEYIK